MTAAAGAAPRSVPAGAALLAYAGAVVGLTFPLAPLLATHLPLTSIACPFDPLLQAWALSHESRALFAPASLADAHAFFPAPYALFYGETAVGLLPYFAPAFLLADNAVLALNAAFLTCIVLTAWTLHLVTVHWTGSAAAGFVAGGTFLLTRWVLWSGPPCNPNYAALQYLPLIVAATAAPLRGHRRVLALLGLLVLQALSGLYVLLAVFVPLVGLGLLRAGRRRAPAEGVRLLALAAAAGALVAPLFLGHLAVRLANPDLLAQTWWRFAVQERLPGGAVSYWTPLGLPAAAIALIAVGAVVARRHTGGAPRAAWRAAGFWALAGALLSLTPEAWWGERLVLMPHLAPARWLGLYDVIRAPERLGVGALIGASLLTGLAAAACADAVARRTGSGRTALWRGLLAVAVLAACYREYAHGAGVLAGIRGQTFTARDRVYGDVVELPAALRFVGPLPPWYGVAPAPTLPAGLRGALSAGDGPLLELPVGGGPAGAPTLQARAVLRAIEHRRPVLNGYHGYWPAGFPERMAQAQRLPEPGALAALHAETGVELLLVRAGELSARERGRWLALAGGRADLRLLVRDGAELLFLVVPEGLAPPAPAAAVAQPLRAAELATAAGGWSFGMANRP